MLFGTKITGDQAIKLELVLSAILSYLKTSKDSVYADYTVSESSQVITKALRKIQTKKRLKITQLKFLFSPAGALQDISLENNWENEYLDLSKKFDAVF